MKHETVKMKLDGFECDVDAKVTKLIKMMNCSGSSVRTYACCQGDDGPEGGLAYVAFEADPLVAEYFLCHMVRRMNYEWQRMTTKTRGNMEFFFTVQLGDGYIMRWTPCTYKYVLRCVEEGLDIIA